MVQTGFAIAANSTAMLADSVAMFVDALTYLFNLLAERLKHRSYSEREKRMPAHVRHYQRRLHRLYLELIPPLISVTTLVVVTIFAFRDSLTVLLGTQSTNPSDEPDVNIMLLFSALNLGLDAVNVSCFAKANQAVGLRQATHKIPQAHHVTEEEVEVVVASERTPLNATSPIRSVAEDTDSETYYYSRDGAESEDSNGLNLNMCSAWTHVYADTMRSLAVLIAAGIASVWSGLSPEDADASASFMVSVIILVSLAPLLQGLYYTALEIREMTVNKGRNCYPAEVSLVV